MMTSKTEHAQEDNLDCVLDKSLDSGKEKNVWQQSWEQLQNLKQDTTRIENSSQSHASDVPPLALKHRVTQHSALE